MISERKELKEALDQNTLFYAHGRKTKQLCARMARMVKRKHVLARSPCSAAIGAAVNACGVGPSWTHRAGPPGHG